MKRLIEWTATITTLLGALLTSLGHDPINMYALNLGSLLWLIWSILDRKVSIALVNGGMLVIYVYGLVVRHPILLEMIQ